MLLLVSAGMRNVTRSFLWIDHPALVKCWHCSTDGQTPRGGCGDATIRARSIMEYMTTVLLLITARSWPIMNSHKSMTDPSSLFQFSLVKYIARRSLSLGCS